MFPLTLRMIDDSFSRLLQDHPERKENWDIRIIPELIVQGDFIPFLGQLLSSGSFKGVGEAPSPRHFRLSTKVCTHQTKLRKRAFWIWSR